MIDDTIEGFDQWLDDNYPERNDPKWDGTGTAFWELRDKFSAAAELLEEYKNRNKPEKA